jgi:hypothetical protein
MTLARRCLPACAIAFAALPLALALTGCDRLGLGDGKQVPAAASQAETDFAALAAACSQFIAARAPQMRADGHGRWTKTGTSPAQVQHEVTRTESAITPYVGKIVIKDNLARASAATEAEAAAIPLTPAHLLSNRTHTFIYSFDGARWHWQNGQLLTKVPGQNDAMVALMLADVSVAGPGGFLGCLPG